MDQFDSKEDLINAVFTSSFIPGYVSLVSFPFFFARTLISVNE